MVTPFIQYFFFCWSPTGGSDSSRDMTGLKTVSSYNRTQSRSRSKQKKIKVLFIEEVHLAALSLDPKLRFFV